VCLAAGVRRRNHAQHLGGIRYALELHTTRGHFIATAGRGGPPVRVVTDNGPFRIAAC
jgi:hypothetical protein